MRLKTLHTHSMLPRTYHQADNHLERFPQNLPLERDLLAQPRINIRELLRAYVLEVALPGFPGEDIQVYINDSKLFIRAFTRQNMVDGHSLLRNEFNPRIQTRIFHLPPDIDKQHITTNYKNGILKITLLKTDQSSSLN